MFSPHSDNWMRKVELRQSFFLTFLAFYFCRWANFSKCLFSSISSGRASLLFWSTALMSYFTLSWSSSIIILQ